MYDHVQRMTIKINGGYSHAHPSFVSIHDAFRDEDNALIRSRVVIRGTVHVLSFT